MRDETLLLSRNKLATFLVCQRQFQLRYLERLMWPEAPLSAADTERLAQGQQFHRLVQRHFLGLPVEPGTITDRTVRQWWLTFVQHQPRLPHGRFLPELTLTIPIGHHLLNGRFDLLLIGEENGAPFAHVFDWKTGKAQDEYTLRHDWQTRLYLAMLAEGGRALWGEDHGRLLQPEHVAITYWYVTNPDQPCTIHYHHTWHEQNWAEMSTLVAQIATQLAQGGIWPLTADWSSCQVCTYQAFCGRQAENAGTPGDTTTSGIADEEVAERFPLYQEPNLP
jgi:hypothetical protein